MGIELRSAPFPPRDINDVARRRPPGRCRRPRHLEIQRSRRNSRPRFAEWPLRTERRGQGGHRNGIPTRRWRLERAHAVERPEIPADWPCPWRWDAVDKPKPPADKRRPKNSCAVGRSGSPADKPCREPSGAVRRWESPEDRLSPENKYGMGPPLLRWFEGKVSWLERPAASKESARPGRSRSQAD